MPRNVIDKYFDWSNDLIKEDLKKNSFPFAICMSHIEGDFNIGTVLRSANAFGCEKMFYFGQKKYDPRGSVGTKNYTLIQYLESFEQLLELKNEYTFVGLEISDRAIMLSEFQWPAKSLLIVGEELRGLSKEILDICDHIIQIKQYGSVRSLNVGVAASVAMYDFHSKNNSL